MKKYKILIWRNLGCIKKYKEEIELFADEYFTNGDKVEFYKFINGNTLGCEGSYLVGSFKADKYTVMEC
jgi:hypothetical protein